MIWSVAFSPDGRKVLTGSGDGTAKIWAAATAILIRTFPVQAFGVLSAVFSPDGTEVLTGSGDSNARLWDAATGTVIRTFDGHTDYLSSVAFSPDGTKVLTGSWDGTACVWELNPPRAVIVAGGGDFVNNGIAQQTNDLGAYAYKVLKARGYESANIKYLTAFGPTDPTSPTLPFRDADGDGLNDVDGWATLETLRDAITGSFAAGSGRLFVLFVDHGNRTEGFTAFRVNERQALLTTTLDTWLDDLQTSHPVDVALVVDCCYSGQFVADCRETSASLPAGRKRLVLASTSANAEAVFLPPPDMTSFIYQFLGSAYMGNSMGEAWRAGRRFFEEFPVAGQLPQIDDGTTGTGKADKEFFGATWAYGVHSTNDVNRFFPAFESWTTNTVVTPGTSVTLWTRLLPGQNPLEVVAVVRPPAPTVISGDPVSNLPHVSLHQNAGDPRLWEVTTSSVFASLGAYVVSFTARFEYERLSNPVFARITVSEGVDPDATPIRAILALGEGGSPSLDSAFEGLGAYAYGVYLARFQDNGGVHHPEWIEYLTPYPDSQRDGVPTTAGIIAAINNLPGDIGRLYVHLIGNSDAAGTIRFSSGEALTASALDAALDALQTRQTCTVVLAVDCPHSGSFLPVCPATGGQQRVVMAGSRASDTAFLLSWPVLSSFSQKYLGSAYQGNHLKDGYSSARNFFAWFLLDLIQPQMDDNGDGVSNKYDGQLARSLYLGRRYAFAGDKASGLPFVLDVTTTQTAWPNEPVSFTARLVEGIEPTRVFAQLVPPGIDHSSGPISSIQEVAFTRDGPTSWTWTAVFAAPTSAGLYALVVYAAYPDGADERLSEPGYSALDVAWPPDAYEVDDTSATLNYFATNAPGQVHSFHKPNDADWAFFHANGGKIFTITVRDQATRCDAAIHFFKDGLSTGPKVIDNEPAGGAGGSNELYSWLCPTTGTYYVRIVSADPVLCGNGTTYTLRILGNWGANCGLATIATNCSRSTGGTFDAEPMGVYTQPRLTVPPHAFGAEDTKMLVMSPVDVGTNPVNPATRAWMQHPDQHTSNCTIVLFQNYPPVTAFQQPVALTFQMINDGPLYDGWYGAVRVDDLDADDVMANAKVYRWTGATWQVFDAAPTIVGQTVTTLITDLGTGYFAVSAQDPALGSPPAPPPPVPVLNGEPSFTAGATNQVTWGVVSGATAYYAECDDDVNFSSPNQNSGWIAATQWTATGLTDGVAYSYRVKSRNAALLESAWSNTVASRQDASPPSAPAPPSDGGAFTSSTAVRFNWTAATDGGSGVASYDLQVGTTPGGSSVFNANIGDMLTQTIGGAHGQTLYARVRARDAVGNIGGWSANSDGVTVDTVAPRLLDVVVRDYCTIEAVFDEPVVNADKAANYTCTGGLGIVGVSSLSATQYRLFTTDQSPGAPYSLTVASGVKDRAGNSLDSAYGSRGFVGSDKKTAVQRWELYR